MDINDLKQADILLFSGKKGDLVSEAIMYLTDSRVSHAALSYKESGEIVEETPPAVRVSDAETQHKGRTIYVNRLERHPRSMKPVLRAATAYLNDKEPYAMSNLLILGLLLLYRKFTPNTLTQKVMIKIFKRLASAVIDYINRHTSPGKLPMVCSQFVYQCYDDAGADYRLRITKGDLVGASLLAKRDNLSVLDQVMHRVRTDRTRPFRAVLRASAAPAVEEAPVQTEAELARELVAALQSVDVEIPVELDPELVCAVHHFGQAVYSARTGEKARVSTLTKANKLAMPSHVLSFLKAEEAYFVTPGDLLDHCENATRVGVIEL